MTNLNEIHCPICNKEKTWRADNPFRPFCSQRCKMIDLGEWASGNRSVPGEPANPEDDTDPDEQE